VEDTRIARVYAEALFQAASEQQRVEAVRRDLQAFTQALAGSPELRAFAAAESVSDADKSRAVVRLTEGGEPMFRNFMRVLADKGRLEHLGEVQRLFERLVETAAGIVKVELVTAVRLPESMHAEMRRLLETALDKPIDLPLSVDPDIIGGVQMRVGDRIADASIRHRLQQLRARLVKPIAKLEVSVETPS